MKSLYLLAPAAALVMIALAPQPAAAKCNWAPGSPPLWVCDDPNPPKKHKPEPDKVLTPIETDGLGGLPYIVTGDKCGHYRCRVRPSPPPKCVAFRCRVHPH
jgi:hypothetical protein